MNDTSDGRRILLLVGASVVVISDILGLSIGENGGQVAAEISLFGVLSLPTSPLAFSLYGMVLLAALLGVLFGLVEYASHVENARQVGVARHGRRGVSTVEPRPEGGPLLLVGP